MQDTIMDKFEELQRHCQDILLISVAPDQDMSVAERDQLVRRVLTVAIPPLMLQLLSCRDRSSWCKPQQRLSFQQLQEAWHRGAPPQLCPDSPSSMR